MQTKFKTFQVLSLCAAATAASQSLAQQENDSGAAATSLMEEVVVVGNRSINLMDASVPFTSIGEEDLLRQAPRSVADALINIPSLQTNNALGNTNNDFRFRGIGAGGTQFLELEEDGMPITRDAPDFLYRVNSTALAGIDTVRGGNSPIIRTAAMGAVINFKYKEGSATDHEGNLFFQTSDFGMRRGEFWLGGPLSDQLTYSVAGYYTTDDGIREVDFGANEGSNLYANLVYRFADDSGHFKVSGRSFNESAIVYLGTPLFGTATNPEQIPGGPDVTTGSLISSEIVNSTTYCSVSEQCGLNLEDGNQSKMTYFGTEFRKSFQLADAEWEFISRNRYTNDESGFSGYYSAGFWTGKDIATGEQTATSLLYDLGSDIGGTGPANNNFLYGLPVGVSPLSYSLTSQQGDTLDQGSIDNAAQTATSDGSIVANGNGLFMPVAAFNQFNPQKSFQQDLEMNVNFDTSDASHFVSVGYYYLDYDRDENNRQNFRLIDVRPQARRIDLNVVGDDGNTYTVTDNGFLTHNHWLNRARLNTGVNAYYLNYEIQTGKWTIDAGLRRDEFSFEISSVDNGPVYGNQIPVPAAGSGVSAAQLSIFDFNGDFILRDSWSTEETSWTAGVNYRVSDNFGAYGRLTRSYLPGGGGAQELNGVELGARYQGETWNISANLFTLTQDGNIEDRGIVLGGVNQVARVQTDRESQGIEVEANWSITDALEVKFSGTLQDPTFQSGAGATLAPGSTATQAELDVALAGLTNLDGNTIANQPETLFNLGVTYTVEASDIGGFTLSLDARHVGKVYPFDDNSAELSSYTRLNAGLNYESLDGDWYGRLSIQNLADEDAIVRIEGNAGNAFPGAGSLSDGFIGRSVQGRNIVLGVGYRF